MPERGPGLLFDLDGSLIDTAPDMGGALNTLLAQEDKAALPLGDIRPHVSNGSKALVALGFGDSLPAQREQQLITRFLRCYAEQVAVDSQLFSGMNKLLEELEVQGLPWGIITNKPIRFTVPLLEQLGLTQRCATLVCGDSMALRKPDPAPLLLACRQANLNPLQCVYVGDALRDIQAGNAAGMRTVVMGWGYFGAAEDPLTWGANWHCSDAGALRESCQLAGLLPPV